MVTFSLRNVVGLPTCSFDCLEGASTQTVLMKWYTIAETCSQQAVTMLG